MDAVDATLAGLPPRDLVSDVEARDLLGRLDEVLMGAGGLGATGHSIIDRTQASIRGWPAIDRVRIVDPLLDIRNLHASETEPPP